MMLADPRFWELFLFFLTVGLGLAVCVTGAIDSWRRGIEVIDLWHGDGVCFIDPQHMKGN